MIPPLLPMPRSISLGPPAKTAHGPPWVPPSPQAYRLTITPEGSRIDASTSAGKFYAHQTLRQLGPNPPPLQIEDWPDFPIRGVMLDISRDKVPSQLTLHDLIDLFASWKINQLQLYTEHTFAYAGHEAVWKNAGPMTGPQYEELDAHCKNVHIELVPNQNSLGHMERWLKHPRYMPLAESAQGAQTPWGFFWNGPFGLCPTDPASLDLLADLYAQLLPHFSSRKFNVGCDEAFDIGQGRSQAECRRRGVDSVYLEFLHKITALAAAHDRRIQFWADIILNHPDRLAEIPPTATALIWGYEADYPFADHCARCQSAGIPFYVCPGTSSWCSIAGRTGNMIANQLAAAQAGLDYRAAGLLNTDWGDFGHLQYLPFSYPGLAMGAAVSWCLESNRHINLPQVLDAHAIPDPAQIAGRAICDLGNVYRLLRPIENRSALFNILVPSSARSDSMLEINLADLDAAESAIDRAVADLSHSAAPALIQDEITNAAAMLRRACRVGRHCMDSTLESPAALRADMEKIRAAHRRLWLARNREGGLRDSLQRLVDV